MWFIAINMLLGDRAKYLGLIFGIAFTAFLVTFAASYFCGFMTRGFALIAENSFADVWVMDPAVSSVEQNTGLPPWALERVRNVEGVRSALPLAVASAEARFPGGRFQSFQVIGVDDATLAGLPPLLPSAAGPAAVSVLRAPTAVAVSSGGSSGKLDTPQRSHRGWPTWRSDAATPSRELAAGDELILNDRTVHIAATANALPRFPPRPLLYMPLSRARALLPERRPVTFVLVRAAAGLDTASLAARIEARTGLRARTAAQFREDTVRWFLINSEDVGDIASMLVLAMSVGFGVTGIMLYMFTIENLPQYAVLCAMGTQRRTLLAMICMQAAVSALIGTGLGFGLCAIAGQFADVAGYPFRVMWFTPLLGAAMVLIISVVGAALSARPVLRLQPVLVFSNR
ncbi:ABC transporter permease [Massilia sp. PWRC2]|uniref:ABC transporter permease n=1 Tax=Massilia sp. PWRC2 TaxID=2804626 RepID=UPI003CFB3DC3